MLLTTKTSLCSLGRVLKKVQKYDLCNSEFQSFCIVNQLCVRRKSSFLKIHSPESNDKVVSEGFGEIIRLERNEVSAFEKNENEKSKYPKKYVRIDATCKDFGRQYNKYIEPKNAQDASNTDSENSKISDNPKPDIKYKNFEKNSGKMGSLLSLLKSRVTRRKKEKIIVEGKRLINDAIKVGLKPEVIFFSRQSDLESLNLTNETQIYKSTYKSLKIWSDTVNTQGVIAIFKVPQKLVVDPDALIPLTVVCDNVRDPGNLGAILRVLAAVGCERVILTKGCVDIWDSKVLRSAAGAHFRLPIVKELEWTQIEKEINSAEQVLLADNELFIENSDASSPDLSDQNSFQTESLSKIKNLPVKTYASVEYNKCNTVMVVGGETHGLSINAYEIAIKKQGMKICIPMNNKVESLNIAVAVGILSYEIKRQWENNLMNRNKFEDIP